MRNVGYSICSTEVVRFELYTIVLRRGSLEIKMHRVFVSIGAAGRAQALRQPVMIELQVVELFFKDES